jgi:hypothetical protein
VTTSNINDPFSGEKAQIIYIAHLNYNVTPMVAGVLPPIIPRVEQGTDLSSINSTLTYTIYRVGEDQEVRISKEDAWGLVGIRYWNSSDYHYRVEVLDSFGNVSTSAVYYDEAESELVFRSDIALDFQNYTINFMLG